MEKYILTLKGKTYNLLEEQPKFNRLTIKEVFKENSLLYAKCTCDCGNSVDRVLVKSLVTENTKSCGCLNLERIIERNTTHNGSKTRLYSIWQDMRRRCNSPNRKDSKNYYAKGIRVFEEWNDFSVFQDWALKNGYNDSLTIDRIDSNKNYEPSNCRWIEKSEQAKNRSSNHYITFNGKTQTLTDWAKELGINRTTLSSRIRRGMSIEEALTK